MSIVLVWANGGKTPTAYPGCTAHKFGQDLVIYDQTNRKVAAIPLRTISRWQAIDKTEKRFSETG